MNLHAMTKDELIAEITELKLKMADLKETKCQSPVKDEVPREAGSRTALENALARNDRLYRTLVETSRDIIWTLDLGLNFSYVSPSVTPVMGFSVEEMMAQSPLDTLTPESRERIAKAIAEELALEAAGPRDKYTSRIEEIEQYHRDGTTRWKEVTATFLRDDDGKPVGILGVSRDITDRKLLSDALRQSRDELEQRIRDRTDQLLQSNEKLEKEISERKKAEEALRAGEQRLELALHGADLGLWDLNVQSGHAVANKRAAEIAGYELSEVEQTFVFWTSVLHPEDRQRALKAVQAHLEGLTDRYQDEYRVIAKSGETRWVHSRGRVVERDEQGKPVRMVGTYMDITSHKEVQEALRKSEERYRTVADFTYDWEYWVDQSGNFQYVSPSCEHITGYSTQEFFDDPNLMRNILHPDDRSRFSQHIKHSKVSDDDAPHELDFRIIRRDGEVRWISHACRLVRDETGRTLGRRACNRDITYRKTTERDLTEKEARFRTLFENISDGVAIYAAVDNGDDFIVVDFNKAAQRITGVHRDDVVGKRLREVFPGVETFGLIDLLKITWETGRTAHLPVTKYLDDKIEIWTRNFVYRLPSGEVVAVFSDETERKRAEDALRASEAKYRNLVTEAPVGILSIDNEGRILEVNRKALEILGSPSPEATKAVNVLSFGPLVEAGVADIVRRCMKEGSVQTGEMPYVSRWGKTSYLRVLLTPILGENLTVKGCQAVIEDVTDRKMTEEWLLQSQRMLESIFAAVPVGIAVVADRRIHWANEACEKMFGFSDSGEYLGKSSAIIYPTDLDFDTAGETLYQNLETGEVREFDTKLRRNDGTLFDCIIRVAALDRSDINKGIIAVITDMSDRKLAEEALRASEEKYRVTFNNAAVGMHLLDHEGRFVEVNDTLSTLLDRSREELLDLTILDVTHPDDMAESKTLLDSLLQGQTDSYRLEKRYVQKDGSVVWADTFVSAIRDQAGEFRSAVGVITDVTERISSQQTRRTLVTAVEQAAETIEITDLNGTIVYVNPAFERTTGYSREEAIGRYSSFLRIGDHGNPYYENLWDTILKGKVWSGRLVDPRKDGTLIEEEVTVSPIRDDDGTIVNYVAVKRDVSQEVSLQRQLLQAQKMEAVGTLAGGIAHDFNNLLQVAMGYSELLLEEKTEDHADYADLEKIRHAAQNGADLVRRLLTFSRKVEPKLVSLNLNSEIKHAEELLRRTIPKMIDIRLDPADDLAQIHADPSQIEQVLLNLAVNARDAMPDGGLLVLSTRNVVLDQEFCKVNLGAKPGNYVKLVVADTGAGMDKATVEHIFEPFFTTKELGRGTGLGLAMVYGIVKLHNGYIVCSSEPGRGTRFELYLPVDDSRAEPAPVASLPIAAPGTETVLLVDDEDLVRELGTRILTRAGYTVLTAANGREALDIFRKDKDHISLVILDLIMPEMGGKECIKDLLKIDPHANILMASGCLDDASMTECLELGARGFVGKPLDMKEFLGHVRQVLDRG